MHQPAEFLLLTKFLVVQLGLGQLVAQQL